MQLFCKLSSSGSSDPYHFGGTRSVLSWETIVHYPRYKLRGQIRLKDTTLSLGSDLLFNHCLYYRFVSFKYFMFLILNEHGNNNLKTNFIVFVYRFFFQIFWFMNLVLFVYRFTDFFFFEFSYVRLQNFWFTNLFCLFL